MTISVQELRVSTEGKCDDFTTQAVVQSFNRIAELYAKGVERVAEYGLGNVQDDFGHFSRLPSLYIITSEDKIGTLRTEAQKYNKEAKEQAGRISKHGEFNSWGSPTDKVPELRAMWASFRHWRHTSIDAGKTSTNVGESRMMSTFFTAKELNAIDDEIIRIGNLIGFSIFNSTPKKNLVTATLLDRFVNTNNAAAPTHPHYQNGLPFESIDDFSR